MLSVDGIRSFAAGLVALIRCIDVELRAVIRSSVTMLLLPGAKIQLLH